MKCFGNLKYIPLLGAGALVFSSCGGNRPPGSDYLAGVGGPVHKQASGGPHHPPPAIPDDISYWDDHGASGSPLIKINRGQQKAFFYKGGTLVGVSKISSGTEDHGTPSGTYKVIQKSRDHKSSLYGVFKDRNTGT